MMHTIVNYKGSSLKINLWSIGDEKDFLLNYGNIENEKFEKIIKELSKCLILKNNKKLENLIEETHYIDLLYILFKCSCVVNASSKKEYSVKCKKCSNSFQTLLDIEDDNNIYFKPYYKQNINIDNYNIDIISKDLSEINDNILDNLSIQSYKFLKKYIPNLDWNFYIKGEACCNKCGEKNIFINDYKDIFLNIIIETDLKYYYDTLFFLKKTIGISTEEFNNMKNFEIEVLVTKMNDLIKQELDKNM